MKLALAVFLCVFALVLGQECSDPIQEYYTCIDEASSSSSSSKQESSESSESTGPSMSQLEQQISSCFTKASCKDPLGNPTEGGDSENQPDKEDKDNEDMIAMNDAIGTCLHQLSLEDERPMVEECVSKEAKIEGFKFSQLQDNHEGSAKAMLLSVVSAVYNKDICSNDKAREDVASCLQELGTDMFQQNQNNEEECKQNPLDRALTVEKKRWEVIQSNMHCYNNVTKECRTIIDSLPETACECATKLFQDSPPKELVEKFESCVTETLGSETADRLGSKLKENMSEAKKTIGSSFCPSNIQGGGPEPEEEDSSSEHGPSNPPSN